MRILLDDLQDDMWDGLIEDIGRAQAEKAENTRARMSKRRADRQAQKDADGVERVYL